MAKNTELAKPSKVAPRGVPQEPKAAEPAKLTPVTAAAIQEQKAEATTKVAKVAKERTADRDTCKAVRAEMDARAIIVSTHKPIAARQGSLRHNIVEAIRGSKSVIDACTKEVNGPGKHAETPYRIKKVDVGFAVANGYISLAQHHDAK